MPANSESMLPAYLQKTRYLHEAVTPEMLRLKGGWESFLEDVMHVQCTLYMPPIVSPTRNCIGVSPECAFFGASTANLVELLMPSSGLAAFFSRTDI